MESGPFSEVWGGGPEVDGDVPDVSGEDANEFSLGKAELVVEAADDSFGGEGLVLLDEVRGEVLGGEGVLVEDFSKPSATICEAACLDEFNGLKRSGKNLHFDSLAGVGEITHL